MNVKEAEKLVRQTQTRHDISLAKIHEFEKKVKLAEAHANAAKLQFKEARKSAKQARKNRKIALQQASIAETELGHALKKLAKARKKAGKHKQPKVSSKKKKAPQPSPVRHKTRPASGSKSNRSSIAKKAPAPPAAVTIKTSGSTIPMMIEELEASPKAG